MAGPSTAFKINDAEGFDPGVIEGLAAIMPHDAIRELLTDMICDARLRLERLSRVKVTAGTLRKIEHDAHDLKSMSGNFGLNHLSRAAAGVESAARQGSVEKVRAALPGLVSTGRASLAALVSTYRLNVKEAS